MSFKYYIRGVEGTLTIPDSKFVQLLATGYEKRNIYNHSYSTVQKLIRFKEANYSDCWVTTVHWASCDRVFERTFNQEPFRPASRWGDYKWNDLPEEVKMFLEAVIEDRFTIVDG